MKNKFSEFRVLVVEDNLVDRELIKVHLAGLGFTQVQEAPNGKIASFKIDNAAELDKQFHLILLDWLMPSTDGLSLLKMIRSNKGEHRVGVIMLTSVSDQKRVKDAIREGVDDFLLKPVDVKLLLAKIEKVLDRLNLNS